MPILILADHDNATLKPATAHAVTAAAKLGTDIHVLVAGRNAASAADAASRLDRRRQGAGRRRCRL